MRHLSLAADGPLRLLILGAHADDIEIGCGGTLLRLASEGLVRAAHWVVFSADGLRADEARAGVAAFAAGVPQLSHEVLSFRDGYFPADYGRIKDHFETLKALESPDLVLVHRRDDLHQDHRLLAEMAWTTFRDHLILEYEIPKWDADLDPPNTYVELTAELVERKAALLAQVFPSQAGRHWFTRDTFVGLARVRGIESRAAEGYAEGFHARKLVW